MANKYMEYFKQKCKDETNISDVICGVEEVESELFIALLYEGLMDTSDEEKQKVINTCDYVCSLLDTEEKECYFVKHFPEMPLLFATVNDFTNGNGNSKIYDLYQESPIENFSLEIIKTYLFMDEPLIYLAEDNKKQTYFCMAIPHKHTLITKILPHQIQAMENNQVPIRDLFTQSTEENLILINERDGIATNMHPNELTEDMLPPAGEYLYKE